MWSGFLEEEFRAAALILHFDADEDGVGEDDGGLARV